MCIPNCPVLQTTSAIFLLYRKIHLATLIRLVTLILLATLIRLAMLLDRKEKVTCEN